MKANLFLKDYHIDTSDHLIEQPIISVLLPTFCRGNNGLLKRAIESVLCQTFTQFELIVIDDGSLDETETVMRQYLEKDHRIIYIRNNINCGLPSLRINQGMNYVRGQYIAYQFDDDFWLENALENLYHAIKDQDIPSLVYGKVELKLIKKGEVYPFVNKFEYYDLQKRNCIANNAVLHSKELPWLYGGYDCHLALRRLCDWDLWLRWAKEVPFIFLDHVISQVEAEHDGAIGLTCPLDIEIFRLFQSMNRNHLLTPETFKDYNLDKLDFIQLVDKQEAAYNQHILPWYLNHRQILDEPIKYNYDKSKKKILVIKNDYDATIDITLTNFVSILKDEYQLIYVPEEQLHNGYLDLGDILIFHRTFHMKNLEIIEEAKLKGLPTFYYLDDDLINMNHLGEGYEWTRNLDLYVSLISHLKKVDTVIVYSEGIKNSVQPYNQKIIQLKTNILQCYMKKFVSKFNEPIKIAFSGSGGRKDEIEFIWKELVEISNKYKDKVVFYFWGYRPEKLDEMTKSQWHYQPFTFSYYEYIARLSEQSFDIFLAPLFCTPFKKSKSPIKYLESVICGAIGLYSNIEPYSAIIDNHSGIKVENRSGEWRKKIEKVISMKTEEKKRIYENAYMDIKTHFTTESQIEQFRSAMVCGYLNYLIGDGVICYVLKTGFLTDREKRLLSHATLTKKQGFNVLVCTGIDYKDRSSELKDICSKYKIPIHYIQVSHHLDTRDIDIEQAHQESEGIQALIHDRNIKLIHSINLCISVELACRATNTAHIASVFDVFPEHLYQQTYLPKNILSDSVFYTNLWQRLTGARGRCIRSYFEDNLPEKEKQMDTKVLFNLGMGGNIRSSKGHHKVIKAINNLKEKYKSIHLHILVYEGYVKSYKDYLKAIVKKYNLVNRVTFHYDPSKKMEIMSQLDGWIIAGKNETLSISYLEAIMHQIPIISVPSEGIMEWIKDGETGIVCEGFDVKDITDSLSNFINYKLDNPDSLLHNSEKLYQIMKDECNSEKVLVELFKYYKDVISERSKQ